MDALIWFLVALPLALDVFAAGLVFGLAGLERSRWPGVAVGLGIVGGIMIAIGILLGDSLEGSLGTAAKYLAGALLLVIGVRGIIHGIKSRDDTGPALLTYRKIATTGFAVVIDKLAVGLSFALLGAPVAELAIIVGVQAFVATWLGLVLGQRLGARADDIAEIVAGLVFTGLGIVILYQAGSASFQG